MRYQNAACACCGALFTETDDVVVCPVCGAPHHPACWAKENRCACSEKHEEGFVWRFPEPEQAPVPAAPAATDGDTVYCPYCGSGVYHKILYCPRCGAPLHGDQARQNDGDAPDFERILDNYDRYGGLDPEAEVDGIPCRDYSQFIGGSLPGRVLRKIARAERAGSRVAWSFAAFVFGPLWFLYRKMVKEGAVLLAIHLVLTFSIVGCVLTPELRAQLKAWSASAAETSLADETASASDLIADMQDQLREILENAMGNIPRTRALLMQGLQLTQLIVLPLLCGLFGLWFFRRRARTQIGLIRDAANNPVAYYEQLRYKGGTSVVPPLIGAAVFAAAYFIFANILFSAL